MIYLLNDSNTYTDRMVCSVQMQKNIKNKADFFCRCKQVTVICFKCPEVSN